MRNKTLCTHGPWRRISCSRDRHPPGGLYDVIATCGDGPKLGRPPANPKLDWCKGAGNFLPLLSQKMRMFPDTHSLGAELRSVLPPILGAMASPDDRGGNRLNFERVETRIGQGIFSQSQNSPECRKMPEIKRNPGGVPYSPPILGRVQGGSNLTPQCSKKFPKVPLKKEPGFGVGCRGSRRPPAAERTPSEPRKSEKRRTFEN